VKVEPIIKVEKDIRPDRTSTTKDIELKIVQSSTDPLPILRPPSVNVDLKPKPLKLFSVPPLPISNRPRGSTSLSRNYELIEALLRPKPTTQWNFNSGPLSSINLGAMKLQTDFAQQICGRDMINKRPSYRNSSSNEHTNPAERIRMIDTGIFSRNSDYSSSVNIFEPGSIPKPSALLSVPPAVPAKRRFGIECSPEAMNKVTNGLLYCSQCQLPSQGKLDFLDCSNCKNGYHYRCIPWRHPLPTLLNINLWHCHKCT
jgi:hypothetical protein